MKPLWRRLQTLQMKHFPNITLEQANNLRKALHSLENHDFERWANKIKSTRTPIHEKLTYRLILEDDGREQVIIRDAFNNKHNFSL